MTAYLIEITAIWAILYLVFFCFLRKETFFELNRWYLLSSIVMGLALPALKLIAINLWSNDTSITIIALSQIQEFPYFLSQSITPDSPSAITIFFAILKVVYILGAAFFIARLTKGLYSIYNLYQIGYKQPHGHHTIVKTYQDHLPFSFLRYVFISTTTPLSDNYNEILSHELKHVRSFHTIDVLFLEILNIVFWFHPMVYFYKSAIRQTHEYIADEAALISTSKKAYGNLLVKQAISGIQIALVNHFFHSHIKTRINMMYQTKSSKKAWVKYLFSIPVIALFTIIFISQRNAIASIDTPISNSSIETMIIDTIIPITPPIAQVEEIYKVVEQMPMWKGCETKECSDNALIKYLYEKLKYPEIAKTNGVEGRVYVQFVIDQNGSIYNSKIVRDIGSGCGEAALEVVKSMNNAGVSWQSGLQRGKKVKVLYTLPIIFELDKKRKNNIDPSTSINKVTDHIYKVVDHMPLWDGNTTKHSSDSALIKYVYDNIKYPELARKNKIEGRVYVQFVIGIDGKVRNSKIVRNIGDGCGEEVLRMVKTMNEGGPFWEPGILDGQKVNVLYTLPVSFIIEKKDELETLQTLVPNKNQKINIDDEASITPEDIDNALYLLDGKEISKTELKNIDPTSILSLHIIKGKEARIKYPEYNNGRVVDITSISFEGGNSLRTSAIPNPKDIKSVLNNHWLLKDNENFQGTVRYFLNKNEIPENEAKLYYINYPNDPIRISFSHIPESLYSENTIINVSFSTPDLIKEKSTHAQWSNAMGIKSKGPRREAAATLDSKKVKSDDFNSKLSPTLKITRSNGWKVSFEYTSKTRGRITARIHDISGKVVDQKNLDKTEDLMSTQLIIRDINSGIYILSIVDELDITSKQFSYTM